jgi:FlaA1/EpsC-like NDP-sugar epimerase
MKLSLRQLVGTLHPRLAVVAHDLVMVWLAWYGTNWLRYSLLPQPPQVPFVGMEVPIVLAAQGVILWWTGLYRGLWRFASLPDLWNIAKAGVLGSLAIAIGLFLFNRLEGVPRSVLFLYPVALVVLLGAPRLLYRYWKDSRLDLVRGAPLQRVLILGAGRAGEALVRDMRRDAAYRAVGFLDDNQALRGAKLHEVPVLGTLDDLERVATETAAGMLLIAMPSASNQQMQRVVELCERSGLAFRTVPRLQDVVEGRSSFNQLKEVAIEDLLGREPISLDWTAIRSGLSRKRVLVTGGGGSIGAELCRQVARLGAESLAILELSEYNLYRIEQELRREFPELLLEPILGDCTDAATCERALARARADLVFHAAAYKHVPLLEDLAREAIRNNLLGTQAMLIASDQYRVGCFVLISTDKAVNPVNIMGASKRAAETLCQSYLAHSGMRCITVRFGNVLDSAGSVVPRFREQIRAGGPVTVTHPEISRYFMTIPEACQLILQAAVLGQGSEIFALDMGEPVKISYLAEQMIRLAGKEPERDIRIVYTGLRPGEKLFEELFHEQESYESTAHPKIFLAASRSPPVSDLTALMRRVAAASQAYDESELLRLLRQLVPEFDRTAAESGAVISMQRVRR